MNQVTHFVIRTVDTVRIIPVSSIKNYRISNGMNNLTVTLYMDEVVGFNLVLSEEWPCIEGIRFNGNGIETILNYSHYKETFGIFPPHISRFTESFARLISSEVSENETL